MNRQTRVKNKQESHIFYRVQWEKTSKYCCHSPFHPPIFCRHSLKLLPPTLPKLMKWILLSPPPLSSDPDTPQNLERAQDVKSTEYLLDHFVNYCFSKTNV